MSNPLFNLFMENQNGGQLGKQFNDFVSQLDSNTKAAPQKTVQRLINSGQMSSFQFEQYRQIANKLTGKNY